MTPIPPHSFLKKGVCFVEKYSRVSFQAHYNYYQCLQLAHMIEQLVVVAIQL